MRAVLAVYTALHLRVVQVGIHVGSVVDEPRVDVLCDSLSVRVRAVKSPCEGVEKYSVGEAVKVSDVVHGTAVWVELSVARVIDTLRPD